MFNWGACVPRESLARAVRRSCATPREDGVQRDGAHSLVGRDWQEHVWSSIQIERKQRLDCISLHVKACPEPSPTQLRNEPGVQVYTASAYRLAWRGVMREPSPVELWPIWCWFETVKVYQVV